MILLLSSYFPCEIFYRSDFLFIWSFHFLWKYLSRIISLHEYTGNHLMIFTWGISCFVLEIYVRHYFDNLLFIAKNIIAKYALLIHCISADSLYLLALPWFCDASTAFLILLFKQTDGNIYGIYKLYMHIIREPLVSYQGLLKATPNNQQNTILNYLSYPS